MKIGAGDLDQRVSIVATIEADDGQGGQTETPTPVGTVWARVTPVRGQERVLADRQAGVQTYQITARNLGHWKALTTSHTLSWGTIELNIRSAPDAGRDGYRTIEAEAGVQT